MGTIYNDTRSHIIGSYFAIALPSLLCFCVRGDLAIGPHIDVGVEAIFGTICQDHG